MTAAEPAIVVRDVHLARGATRAVDGVSFTVPRGERFGVIGPDGAGKTTLFRMLTTLLVPDRGTAVVLGHDVAGAPWAVRPQLGYMPGRFALYPDLSVAENLAFYADVFDTTVEAGMARIAPIWSQLAPFTARRAGALSGDEAEARPLLRVGASSHAVGARRADHRCGCRVSARVLGPARHAAQ